MSARTRRRRAHPAAAQPTAAKPSAAQPSAAQPQPPNPQQDRPGQSHPDRGHPGQDHPGMTAAPGSDPLLAVVLMLLTPLLMIGNVSDARLAAEQAVAAYRSAGQDQLVSIAQIVGFAVTSLDNLRLSMDADLSLPMKLRLRGNATALNRSSQRATTTLDNQRRETPAPAFPQAEAARPIADPDEAPRQARVLAALQDAQAEVRRAQTALRTATPASAEASAEPPDQRQRDLAWATAMTDVAAEYSADMDQHSPAQRRIDLMRIGALARTARALSRGDVPLRSRLLGGTSLHG
jgi:hypothetical protein